MLIGLAIAMVGAIVLVATDNLRLGIYESDEMPGQLPEERDSSRLSEDTGAAAGGERHAEAAPPSEPEASAGVREPPPLTPIKTTHFHIVQNGETLSSIAKKYYGTTSAVDKIFQANRGTLSSPDRIRPGMKIVIPD